MQIVSQIFIPVTQGIASSAAERTCLRTFSIGTNDKLTNFVRSESIPRMLSDQHTSELLNRHQNHHLRNEREQTTLASLGQLRLDVGLSRLGKWACGEP